MGNSRAMKFLSVALAVLASASLAGAQKKYLCPANQTDATITVNNKAKLQFLVAKKTAHNMDCTANYVMGTCSRVKLVCKFKLNGRGKACTGDQALVTANGKTTTLCKGKNGKLSANVNGDFSIQVVTDESKPSKGGKCTIRCTKKGKPKPTTTTAAPTPPPTTGPGNVSTRQAIMADIVGAWRLFRAPGNGFWCDGLWFSSDYPTPCGASNNFYSAAGTGMGLVSEAIMTELGYQTRQQAEERLVQSLNSLITDWPRETFRGFMVHFTNRNLDALRFPLVFIIFYFINIVFQ